MTRLRYVTIHRASVSQGHRRHAVGTMNDLLGTLSAAHFGAFMARDAYRCGYHRQSLSQLVLRGRALRVGPSAYVDRVRYEAATPERRHQMATRAVVRTFDGRVYASHYSALTLMSLPVFGVPLERIHVARVAGSLSRGSWRLMLPWPPARCRSTTSRPGCACSPGMVT